MNSVNRLGHYINDGPLTRPKLPQSRWTDNPDALPDVMAGRTDAVGLFPCELDELLESGSVIVRTKNGCFLRVKEMGSDREKRRKIKAQKRNRS